MLCNLMISRAPIEAKLQEPLDSLVFSKNKIDRQAASKSVSCSNTTGWERQMQYPVVADECKSRSLDLWAFIELFAELVDNENSSARGNEWRRCDSVQRPLQILWLKWFCGKFPVSA